MVWFHRDAASCCFRLEQARRRHKADGENSRRTGGRGRNLYVCICCSEDGQLWRSRVRSWKENLRRPFANLTPLLRMNQKRNTMVVEHKGKWERKRGWPKKWNQLSLVGAATHAQDPVQVQSNAQFAFTGISEMFHQARNCLLPLSSLLFVPLKYIWGVATATTKAYAEFFSLSSGVETHCAHIKPSDGPPPGCTGATFKEKLSPHIVLFPVLPQFKARVFILLHLMPEDFF